MVEQFDSVKHYDEFEAWWIAHGMRAPGLDMIPTYGLIVKSVAAGFLITTDCNLGLLEFYVTNPKADKKERDLALDLITRGLIEFGAENGISNFKCDTQRTSIVKRAERFEFRNVGQFTNMFLSLEPGDH